MVSVACFPRARIGGKLVIFIYKKTKKTKTQTHGAKCWIFMDFWSQICFRLPSGGISVQMGWNVGVPPPWVLWVTEATATPCGLYSFMACSYIEQHSRVSYIFRGLRLGITPAGASGLWDGKAYFVCTGFLSPLYAGGPSSGSSARLGIAPQW